MRSKQWNVFCFMSGVIWCTSYSLCRYIYW